jgi:hypothetical protein
MTSKTSVDFWFDPVLAKEVVVASGRSRYAQPELD